MYKLKILDTKPLGDRQWLLCKGSLSEYLDNLKEEFYNFSIQRKIVKNEYLDTLVTTIKDRDPIPVITLTYNSKNIKLKTGEEITLDMDNVEILDGLQRTFRLWAHNVIIKEYEKLNITSPIEFAKEIKDKYPIFFDTGIFSLTKIKNFYNDGEFTKIKKAFEDFDVYFIVWVNLSYKKVIHKMLVLNAGQRSVSKTHQFELLFLYLWEDLQKEKNIGINLFREKDPNATKIKSGVRKSGDYMFSSIIVGLRSYIEKKPLRISTDDLDIFELTEDESLAPINEEIFNSDFIKLFLQHIKALDDCIINLEGEEGKKWFVKDTTLSGILAGLGSYSDISNELSINKLKKITGENFDKLLSQVKEHGFKLDEFTKQYNILSSRSVNIGNFIRNVIMEYTISLLKNEKSSWESIFNSKSKTR